MAVQNRRVLVTGGAGYAGAVLVPQLLQAGFAVTVLDLFLFGEDVLSSVAGDANLTIIKGDLRDAKTVREALKGCTDVIHLACISNDPSFELNPVLGRSINLDAFLPLVQMSRDAGVSRFIFASSSSVYGISESPDVTEDHPLNPLTDYSRFKAECESILLDFQASNFTTLILRPATLCGYSPRQRLDLTVNILTNHAMTNRRITVFGGSQLRPNFHVRDMADLYVQVLQEPVERIAGQTFNAGYENHSVSGLAEIVKQVVEKEMGWTNIEIVTTPSDDLRSYHISSGKIARVLGYRPRRSIEDAVRGLIDAFRAGQLPDSMKKSTYFNVKRMQEVHLQ
jgi:nucleoside-diphosphate-sugar epimerase